MGEVGGMKLNLVSVVVLNGDSRFVGMILIEVLQYSND